jgi:hypothetical protein
MKNGTYLFDSIMYVGYVGVATAIKPDAFSISINQRDPTQSIVGMLTNIGLLLAGFQ